MIKKHPFDKFIMLIDVCAHCNSEVTEMCGDCIDAVCEPCHAGVYPKTDEE